jgi:urease accessory protein
MRRVIQQVPAGHWPIEEGVGNLTLDFDSRHRRRLRLKTDAGDDVLLDLPKTVAMEEGDGLRLEEGGWLVVRAAAEPILEIQADSPHLLMRVAWHLGNRHLATEIHPTSVRIRPDHVIEKMLRGLGARVHAIEAPFSRRVARTARACTAITTITTMSMATTITAMTTTMSSCCDCRPGSRRRSRSAPSATATASNTRRSRIGARPRQRAGVDRDRAAAWHRAN